MAKYDEIETGLGTYHAVYERDESGAWNVHVEEAPICHTWGNTIAQARERVRDALGLLYDDADAAEIVDRVMLDAKAERALKLARTKREAAEKAEKAAAQARVRFLREAFAAELGTPDVAAILGVTRQRVHSLAKAEGLEAPPSQGRRTTRTRRKKVAAKKARRKAAAKQKSSRAGGGVTIRSGGGVPGGRRKKAAGGSKKKTG